MSDSKFSPRQNIVSYLRNTPIQIGAVVEPIHGWGLGCLFTFVISLWHWKFVTADVTAVFVNNQHGIQWRGQDFDKNTLSIHSYACRGIEIGAPKMQFVCIFFISADCLQKIWFFYIPRYCSNMPKVRWVVLCGFVANFTSFSAVQKFWKSVKIWQS